MGRQSYGKKHTYNFKEGNIENPVQNQENNSYHYFKE